MNKLIKQKLISKEPYGPITLTEKGKTFSREINRKHRLIDHFLKKSLELTPDESSENACRMEHIVTDAMIEAIESYLDNQI